MYIGMEPAGGYGMSWGPYPGATGRIMPFVGGPFGTCTHIVWPYCAPLTTICRGTGLGVIGMGYTIVGLGEFTTVGGYPGYAERTDPFGTGGGRWETGWRWVVGDDVIGADLLVLIDEVGTC